MGLGSTGLINIFLSLIFISISWWAIQCFRLDLFVKDYKSAQVKALQILLSIALGHGVARFFMDYLGWSMMLKQLFMS
ncbi:DUF1146 family protein [Ammoniphilus sp. CFH 90114]|uniref:DUF1146 family protein n=1 Tax=Ammoniphilus sp. CFH 90114 TaxID=2493665 RepID=UPI00100FC7CC|nr:DUF1146 family protein [Ammoniphilus sp. CFH 90114]RXT04381.1 DUF1146 domain-containing protein [Ammoniphilus sp. CFH 90114]